MTTPGRGGKVGGWHTATHLAALSVILLAASQWLLATAASLARHYTNLELQT